MHEKQITDLSPLARMEFDGGAVAEKLLCAYLQRILVNGFFHADPHPGNIFLTDDYQITLIDLGMVGRIMPGLQEQLTFQCVSYHLFLRRFG
jgi:ubiquinone biosynthesis protein